MITPGTTADWIMAASLLGAVVAFGATGSRWMLKDEDLLTARASQPDLRGYRVHDLGRVREAERVG